MTTLGVVMDPIAAINIKKDSTFAMLLEGQARGWELQYMELNDLCLVDGECHGRMRRLRVQDQPEQWFEWDEVTTRPLHELDVILMRKDPPIDLEYIFATHILEMAERKGALVVNKPQSLRDANEKLFTAWFPQCTVATVVTRSRQDILDFLQQQHDIILKPLDSMGGASIFRVRQDDPNTNVIIETLTHQQQRYIMAQCYIPEISAGDKRILLIDGEPVPYALARVPPAGETRGNLAVGGKGVGVALSERDYWICEQVAPVLKEKGLMFVGLDVIGDYLTEINVTSPTCIRELDKIYGLNISATLFDSIGGKLARS
jgi:glutathione synthase